MNREDDPAPRKPARKRLPPVVVYEQEWDGWSSAMERNPTGGKFYFEQPGYQDPAGPDPQFQPIPTRRAYSVAMRTTFEHYKFQPTPPRGGRLASRRAEARARDDVSIHAPTRGATRSL